MRITKVKLDNYVCFYNAPEFQLRPGINFVVGKNNSGKTALLNALREDGTRLARSDFAHRSADTVLNTDLSSDRGHRGGFEVMFHLSETDMKRDLEARREPLMLPSIRYTNYGMSYHTGTHVGPGYLENGLTVVCTIRPNFEPDYKVMELDSLWVRGQNPEFYEYLLNSEQRLVWTERVKRLSLRAFQSQWQFLAELISQNIFGFDAERRVSATAPTARETRLLPDCSNLAQVLNTLNGMQTSRFGVYLGFVRTIFPSVKEVLFDYPESEVEVRISYYDQDMELPQLARSLSECGTGLGQVMAMLYVVVTSDDPRVIIIDEPQSYLHPGAVRKLLEIFQLPRYSHHQYILTTHSPTAIASVREKHILLLNRKDMKTAITPIDQHKSEDIETLLRSVGARLSDVFGMDSIIWVEGETDEECFPMILRAHNIPLFGTRILRLAHTGDLTSEKHAASAVKLYKRLSAGEAHLPPALAFVFDADQESKLTPVKAEIGKQIKLLKRQNYESYLLDADAIAEILREDDEQHFDKHSADSVQQWIDDNFRRECYYPKKEFDESDRINRIDGANFLAGLFNCLTNTRVEYRKIDHSPRLTALILKQNPDHFQDIVDILKPLLDPDQSEDKPART